MNSPVKPSKDRIERIVAAMLTNPQHTNISISSMVSIAETFCNEVDSRGFSEPPFDAAARAQQTFFDEQRVMERKRMELANQSSVDISQLTREFLGSKNDS